MNALLRKDWRLYRPTVLGCLVVLAGVYLIGVLPLVQEDPKAGPYSKPRQVVNVALLATGVTAVFAGVFGASAFAVERRDRTAEFLVMLPISRTRILASKAAVAAVFLLAVWAVHLSVALAAVHTLGAGAKHTTEYAYAFAALAGATVMMFSLAWLSSAFLSGPAIPFGLALGGTVADAAPARFCRMCSAPGARC
jgi:ABC-type transport system involved in multi-copper enzyme maturation permease subunit